MPAIERHKVWATLALGGIVCLFAFAVVVEIVLAPPRETTPSVRIAIDTEPATAPAPVSTKQLERAAVGPDPLRRVEAVKALGTRPEGAPRLVAALDDADQRVREAAARALLDRPDGPAWAEGRPPSTPEGLGDLLRQVRERPEVSLHMQGVMRRALGATPPARSEAVNVLARLSPEMREPWRKEIEALTRGDGSDAVTLKAIELLREMGS